MKLSIIIPHHHETQTKMKPLLDSLENQQGVNWDEIEILISHDSKSSPEINLEKYPNLSARTTQYSMPGLNNVGMNRQNALNHAAGELIAFCDADDKLSTPLALHLIPTTTFGSFARCLRLLDSPETTCRPRKAIFGCMLNCTVIRSCSIIRLSLQNLSSILRTCTTTWWCTILVLV